MYYPPRVKTKAIAELTRRRTKAEREYQIRRAEALEKIPGIAELEAKISSAGAELCRVIGMGDDALRLVEQIKRDNLAAQRKERELLVKHGLAADAMRVRYICPVCDDTGFGDDGKFCECHKILLKEFEHARLSEMFPLDRFTFESFSLTYYPPEQRRQMRDTLETCREYAREYHLGLPGLFFYGEPGLGKTHLSGAIINEVIKRGFGVEYGSVPVLLARLAKERFDSRSDNITERALLAADLLVLDDLGAESVNSFTLEALYTIINTRLLKQLPTIVNSNCAAGELQERYGRRIASRLLYEGYETFCFTGMDIREKKTEDMLP
ncbi:MAG: ATP-binding protein [Oscillospiraceae bacterium]|jgi:DNA replication protein DnaC|nr:ATP-binding protein [Oscillospiraceae bacterium]